MIFLAEGEDGEGPGVRLRQSMSFSVSRAAKETGLSKSTISRAIKSGRISAQKQDDGSYLIEPAELFRVYRRRVAQPRVDAMHDAPRNRPEQAAETRSGELEIVRAKLELTQAMLAREQETVADLRKRLDVATERVLSLTKVAQPGGDAGFDASCNRPQPKEKRGFWARLRGR